MARDPGRSSRPSVHGRGLRGCAVRARDRAAAGRWVASRADERPSGGRSGAGDRYRAGRARPGGRDRSRRTPAPGPRARVPRGRRRYPGRRFGHRGRHCRRVGRRARRCRPCHWMACRPCRRPRHPWRRPRRPYRPGRPCRPRRPCRPWQACHLRPGVGQARPASTVRRQRCPSRVSSTVTPWPASSSRSRSDAAKSRAALAAARASSNAATSGSRSSTASGRMPSTRSRSRRTSSARAASAVDSARRSIRRLRSRTRSKTAARRSRDVQVVVECRAERLAGRVERVGERRVVGRLLDVRGERGDQAASSRSSAAAAAASDSSEWLRPGPVVDGDRVRGAAPAARRPARAAPPTRAMFPVDLAILAPPIWRWAQCSQVPTNGWPVAASLWAISSSWCGKMRSTPPVWMSNDGPRWVMLIAEHSMCQPGRPGPIGGLPRRLARLGALPQREVADVVLAVLVGLDPLPHPQSVGVEARQPTVRRPRRDPEEDRPVVGPVGVAALEQRRR